MQIDDRTKERFWNKVAPCDENGCMDWMGTKFPQGYGNFALITKRPHRKWIGAHKFSYILHFGSISEGLDVCHKCDRPMCVAPEHLFLGTRQENMQDMVYKKRYSKFNVGSAHRDAKLTEGKVIAIRAKINAGITADLISQEYDITKNHIQQIKHRVTWKHI